MQLGRFARTLAASILIITIAVVSFAQTQKPDARPANGSISGQVKAGGVPLANKTVIVMRMENRADIFRMSLDSASALDIFRTAKTDADGRYNITGLRAGNYEIHVEAAAFAPAKRDSDRSRTVTLDDDQNADNINFSLVRGGVITGRAMDADGRPLIAQPMQLKSAFGEGETREFSGVSAGGEESTDDRGVYRLFGLAPGKYIIGVGGRVARPFGASSKYPLTYFPGTTDEKQARIIEIAEGSEITDIDIRLGGANKTYEVTGHVVDADSGQPIPKTTLLCIGQSSSGGAFGYSNSATSDAKGEFRLSGLAPGKYRIQLTSSYSGLLGNPSEHYAEETTFEVLDANVSGVQVQARRGAILNGVVVIEGTPEQKNQFNLGQMMMMAFVEQKKVDRQDDGQQEHLSTSDFSTTKLNADGSFRMAGLPPGKVSGFNVISIAANASLKLKRIEQNGVVMTEGIETRPGETISGVKIVLGTASGSIRGQINFSGGKLPDGGSAHAIAVRADSQGNDRDSESAEVDSKGRFVIEGLMDGEYQILIVFRPGSGAESTESGEQRVRVANGAETTVTIPFDPNKKREERQ